MNKNNLFKKYKSFIIGSCSILLVAGITIGATSPFLTKTINYFVSNNKINIKSKNSLFFVTDGGDIHDGSFNEAAYDEIIGIAGKHNYQAPNNSNYSTLMHAYNQAVSRGASVLEVNGFLHGDPLKEFTHNNPDIGIIFLDSVLNIGNKPQGNVASIIFKTEQVGFLAGYAAAAWASNNHNTNPNKKGDNPLISGVGGLPIEPVISYLAGFEEGMDLFNTKNLQKPKVELYIKDVLHKPAKYFGGFESDPQNQVSSYAKQALAAGVDVIFPVGGPQAFTVIRELKKSKALPDHIKVMGVDQDLTNQSYAGLPAGGDWTKYILGSATKSIGNSISSLSSSIFDQIINGKTPGTYTNGETKKGVFGKIYSGDLKNEWVSLAGQKINGKTQNLNELFESLGIIGQLSDAEKSAEKATPTTPHYGGK